MHASSLVTYLTSKHAISPRFSSDSPSSPQTQNPESRGFAHSAAFSSAVAKRRHRNIYIYKLIISSVNSWTIFLPMPCLIQKEPRRQKPVSLGARRETGKVDAGVPPMAASGMASLIPLPSLPLASAAVLPNAALWAEA